MNLVFVLLLSVAFAGPVAPSPSCAVDTKDAFEPRFAFTRGKFKDKCVDARSVRAIKILSEDPTRVVIANFYDKGQFWRASIPLGAVETMYFQIVPFDSGVPLIKAAHTQFRFKLRAPIDLESQDDATHKAQAEDVILSSTFVAPPDVDYSAIASRGGSYGIVTRLLSSYQRGLEEIVKDKSMVRQFELRLSAEEKNALFVASLRKASLDGYDRTYGLLQSNCTTIVFDLLDEVHGRPSAVAPMRGSYLRIFDEFIEPSIAALRARGLIDDQSEVQPMNADFQF